MTVLSSVSAANDTDLLTASRSRLAELTAGLESAGPELAEDLPRRARRLLDVGRHDEAHALVPELLAGEGDTPPARATISQWVLQAAAILFSVHDYEPLRALIEAWSAWPALPAGARRLVYRWWFMTDDLERVEQALQGRGATGDTDLVDRLARARLHALLLEREAAQTSYEAALAEARTDEEKAWALHGLGVVLYHRLDFDGAFARLTEALAAAPLDPDLLSSLSDTLIRLSRTDQAIDLLELAVELAPYHERAHYMLGNGYARRSYTQLHAAYPEAFADGAGRAVYDRAEELVAAGRREEARALYQELRRAHGGWVDLATRLGSLALFPLGGSRGGNSGPLGRSRGGNSGPLEGSRGGNSSPLGGSRGGNSSARRYGEARQLFTEALEICPEYGRAHNGLAKALEAERQRYNVHQHDYDKRFAALTTPQVEGIEDYVANWTELEPRHRAQVALSVAPWARYVPVLLAAGSTHYVKPLHQCLSESPELEHLADERISYDSRLWDDVRGVGGHHTVTGVEDVERIPLNGYNTVLHELTHQVHQVLPAEDRRRIQELYRRTKERDEKSSGAVFLSRYAGGSVWEYFAEGANSLESPRRDRFDTREIVRERLEERDQELMGLVRELMERSDLDGAYTVASVNQGSHHLRWGRVEEAVAALRRALEGTPDSEDALCTLSYALSVAGRAAESLELIEEPARVQSESADLVISYASALWLAGRGLETAFTTLSEARDGVREVERHLVDMQLGSWAWTAGSASAARQAYESVVAYQADHPQGLWGLAAAHALAGSWSEAWKRYEEAVRHRTGIVDLRVAYAWDLLRAGETGRARSQLDAALLLDPDDPDLLALEALWFLENRRPEDAVAKAERALELAPWSDMARWARAMSLIRAGRIEDGRNVLAPLEERIREQSPPEYVYRPEKGSYVLVHTLPALLREELAKKESVLSE